MSPTSICPLVRKGALPGAIQNKIQVEAKQHEGIFLGIKDESEVAVVGTPHGKFFARRIRRVPKEDSGDGLLFNRIRGLPCDLQPVVERDREQSVVGRQSCRSRSTSSTADNRELPRRVYSRRAVQLARHGYTDHCIGCQHD